MSKIITYEKISSDGLTEHSGTAEEVMTQLQDAMLKDQMWLYIDGQPVTAETLNEPELENAEQIRLMYGMTGG